MLQSPTDYNSNSVEDLDTLLTCVNMEPASSTEEFTSSGQQDGNRFGLLYEMDVSDMNIPLYPDQLFQDLLDDAGLLDSFTTFDSDLSEVFTQTNEVLRSTESNDIDAPIQSATDERLAMIKTSPSTLPQTHPQKVLLKTAFGPSISLSQSVAVTNPTPNKLQLVYPLEESFRPRYKSDYFPSKGAVRSPRYVSDNSGHHYVTLQMPTEYPRDVRNEYVRVALLTTSIDGLGQFYSPYKFQRDNADVNIPDENPFYMRVEGVRESDPTMRLHLVLIKSKLDQLNQAQPLKPFSEGTEVIQNIIPSTKVTPKELITKYQLEKSQIAFTLCTRLADGTFDVHSETTVISSIITEAQNKSTSTTAVASLPPPPLITSVAESTPVNSGKKINCPKCAHCFELADVEANPAKRKSTDKSSTNYQRSKKKK